MQSTHNESHRPAAPPALQLRSISLVAVLTEKSDHPCTIRELLLRPSFLAYLGRRFIRAFSYAYGAKLAFAVIGTMMKRHQALNANGGSWARLILSLLTNVDTLRIGSFVGSLSALLEAGAAWAWAGQTKQNALISVMDRKDEQPQIAAPLQTVSQVDHTSASPSTSVVPHHSKSHTSHGTPISLLSRVGRRWLTVGGMAGLSLAVLPEDARAPMAIFVAMRAAEVLVHLGNDTERWKRTERKLPEWLPRLWRAHWSTLIYALGSGPFIYGWLFWRPAMNPAILNWLDFHIHKSVIVLKALTELHRTGSISENVVAAVNAERALFHQIPLDLRPTAPLALGCQLTHGPGVHSCMYEGVRFCFEESPRAFRMYLAVHAIPLIIFKRRLILHKPLKTLYGGAKNVVRSALFLSLCGGMSWGTACVMNKLGLRTPWMGMIVGFFGGLSAAVEPAGRREEMALYGMGQALGVCYSVLRQWGWIQRDLPFGSIALFAAGLSVLVWAHHCRPSLVRNNINGMMHVLMPSSEEKHAAASEMMKEPTGTISRPRSRRASKEENNSISHAQ